MVTSPLMPWKDSRNIRSHPPMTLITTSTIVVQSMTAISETQAMRRLRRYFRMRWSLYTCLSGEREQTAKTLINHLRQTGSVLFRIRGGPSKQRVVKMDDEIG